MNVFPHPRLVPAERIGDAERDLTCDELAKHFSVGRLSDAEMQERMSAAVNARTADDLYDLLSDLPRTRSHSPAAVTHATPHGRAIDVLVGFVSISAAICLVLLFLATAFTYPPGAFLVFLGGLGGSVAVLGAWYFSRYAGPVRRCECPHCRR